MLIAALRSGPLASVAATGGATAAFIKGKAIDVQHSTTHQLGRLHDWLTHINEAVKHLACGAGSAIVSRTAVAPLERVKMELILNAAHGNKPRLALQHVLHNGGAVPHRWARKT